MTSFKNLELYC